MNLRRLFLVIAICFGALALNAHADPAAPPATAPAPVVLPPPATPPPTGQQQQSAPDLVAEEEKNRVKPPLATQSKVTPTIWQRASALLKDKGAIAGDIAQRDQTIADLRQQLGAAQQTIQTQSTELNELRAGRDQLQQALNTAEAGHRTVEQTVASLGFDQTKLPKTGDLEQSAENSIEGLTAKMKTENDPEKQAVIRNQIIALRNKAESKTV